MLNWLVSGTVGQRTWLLVDEISQSKTAASVTSHVAQLREPKEETIDP